MSPQHLCSLLQIIDLGNLGTVDCLHFNRLVEEGGRGEGRKKEGRRKGGRERETQLSEFVLVQMKASP